MVGLNYTVGLEDEPTLHYQVSDSLPDDVVAEIHLAMRDIYKEELEAFRGIPSNIILGRD